MPKPSKQIVTFIHCRQCVEDIKAGRALTPSPRDYGRIELGMTDSGELQVWCLRHDAQIGLFLAAEIH